MIDASSWVSPEARKNGYSVLKRYFLHSVILIHSFRSSQDPAAADAYALGLLLHAVFNPNQGLPATAQPPHPAPLPSSRGSIPLSVFPSFKKLLNPNPKTRISPKQFLAIGMAESPGEGSGFFANNKLVKICLGLDNFSLANESEKATFLRYVSHLH
jgi:SCY1-like protein 1